MLTLLTNATNKHNHHNYNSNPNDNICRRIACRRIGRAGQSLRRPVRRGRSCGCLYLSLYNPCRRALASCRVHTQRAPIIASLGKPSRQLCRYTIQILKRGHTDMDDIDHAGARVSSVVISR